MHLRHIDPRSTDWMDAMVDEGTGEIEVEKETPGQETLTMAQTSAPPGPPASDGDVVGLSAPAIAR